MDNEINESSSTNNDNVKQFQKRDSEPTKDECELPPVESFSSEETNSKKKELIKKSIPFALLMLLTISAVFVGKYAYENPADIMSFFRSNSEEDQEKEKILLANVNASISASKSEMKTYLDGVIKKETNNIYNNIDSQQSLNLEQFKSSLIENVDSKIKQNNLTQSLMIDNKISKLQKWIYSESYVDKKELEVKLKALQADIRNDYSSQVKSLEKRIKSVKPNANLKSIDDTQRSPENINSIVENKITHTLSYQGYELYDTTILGGNPVATIVFDSNLIQRTEGSRVNRGSNLIIKKVKVADSRYGEKYIQLFDTVKNKTIQLIKVY